MERQGRQVREKTLLSLYDTFEQWAQGYQDVLQPVCKKGCDSCCTRNVTITAMEGENILRHIVARGQERWFAQTLARALIEQKCQGDLVYTTNEFAQACFDGRDIDMERDERSGVCPFLKESLCTIYQVRPFACRLFLSAQKCTAKRPALLPDFYQDAATVANQLIEHLGQKEYWGNVLNVLAALLDCVEFSAIARYVAECDPGLSRIARMRIRSAQPLPGFLIGEEHISMVNTFLNSFFETEIEGIQVREILNGRVR
ncbi:MAG: hypothetical protein CSB23_05605 [Deltaproteobacteria bacterium]|nr:MAG: hypothetical protein CSB23_05605 [Deltaproteobacteria bacterium]